MYAAKMLRGPPREDTYDVSVMIEYGSRIYELAEPIPVLAYAQ